MHKIEAVIFDWAGTTVDYGCFAPVEAFAEVFRHYGVEPTMEEIREPMGMLKIDHIRAMLAMPRIRGCWVEKYKSQPAEENVQQMYAIYEEKLLGILDQFADPKPDTIQAVDTLRSMGIRIGSTTGYTDKMMAIVVPEAKKRGYEPDCWFSPDSTGLKGRPYPYMIFRNMEALEIQDVRSVLKVGDTVSDIKEGKNAGVWSAGVAVGSSEMGLSAGEYQALPEQEKEAHYRKVEKTFREAGADFVFRDLKEMAEYISGNMR